MIKNKYLIAQVVAKVMQFDTVNQNKSDDRRLSPDNALGVRNNNTKKFKI